jgi:ribosomal protein S18 acetylase RimI-like enzyme
MIRDAQPADVPALLDLIKELARYEREPDAVETDEAQLERVLFGPNPQVWALVAEEAAEQAADGESPSAIVGCAIWFVNFSTWTGQHGIYLEDLVVRESVRGGGHGRELLARLAAICQERGYRRLDWAVLDWNEPAWGFYRAIGAEPMTEWTGHRVSGDALARLAQPSGV